MQKYNNKEIKTALLDVTQFHKANCKDDHCYLLSGSHIWIEIFNRLGITLTEGEYNLIIKR